MTGSCIDAVTIEIANDNMLRINFNFSCLHDANGINLCVVCHIMSSLKIEIEFFNPYEAIFPNRKLVTRDALRLIKTLRSEGYDVIVKPNDNRPLEYLFKKGDVSFLSDPIVQLLISVPTGIVAGLITNWIQKKVDKEKDSTNVIIINNSNNTIVNSYNKNVPKGVLKDSKKKRKSYAKSIEKCLTKKSPIPGLPFPILLEHKPIIIGWCRLTETDFGLEVEKGIITDKNVYRKMQNGKYKGGSVTGIAKISTCNICNSNFAECNHISGEHYDGQECINTIVEADLIEVSIVKEPINTKTFIKLL